MPFADNYTRVQTKYSLSSAMLSSSQSRRQCSFYIRHSQFTLQAHIYTWIKWELRRSKQEEYENKCYKKRKPQKIKYKREEQEEARMDEAKVEK